MLDVLKVRPSELARVKIFKIQVLFPVLIATLTAILLFAFGLYWATTRSDAISVARQFRETRQAISSSLDQMGLDQESVAVWDDPVTELRKFAPDWQWFDDNIGVWLNNLFGHDHVYILDAADRPIYAVIEGARKEPERYGEIGSGLWHLVETVRGRLADHNSEHERLPGQPLHPTSSVRTSEKAVHATGLVSLGDRPAMASIMRIEPLTDSVSPAPGAEPLLVSVRFLDGKFLQELAKRNLIDSPRFSPAAILQRGEHTWPLLSEHGETIGWFIWKPELPGTALMSALAPITVVSIGLMILIMALLAFWLHRAMAAQAATILELQDSEAQAQQLALQAQHLAFHDTLTGLPNRAKFTDRLEKDLARARRGEPLAVLLLDLDRFKHVNDTLGHLAGDALIREFAERLTHIVQDHGTIARLGGDEFAIALPGAPSRKDVEAVCERIIRSVRQPFDLLGDTAFVGVSIGLAMAPEAGTERVDLMRKADIALYQAKSDGRGCYRLFTPEMDESVKLRSQIEDELRTALTTGEGLKVYYQPQVAGAGQAIIGLEALVRWQHPTLGLIAPDQFIAVAEETSLICQLGEWVLRQACMACRRWPNLFIAVNLSPIQFRVSGFAARLIAIAHEYNVHPSQLELEVTEGVLLDDSNSVSDTLSRLRMAGFRIALDDFGTGYSSLNYLRRFEVDKIKIDRSFVQHLGHTVDSTAIISAVLTLGHAMGLTVTAEGVETIEQCNFLEAAGCNAMQGYLFSQPLPGDEIEEFISGQEMCRGAA